MWHLVTSKRNKHAQRKTDLRCNTASYLRTVADVMFYFVGLGILQIARAELLIQRFILVAFNSEYCFVFALTTRRCDGRLHEMDKGGS